MIPLFKVYMSSEAKNEVGNVLDSGYIGQGSKVEEFEELLKEEFENDYVVSTNSSTSSEHLALHLLKKQKKSIVDVCGVAGYDTYWGGLEDGDEVLTTALTCTATNWPILANNLKIKWVDIDPKTLNMDLDDLARKITRKTKVIMVVHWGGYPIDLDRLSEIQNEAYRNFGFKPVVIEDCAHAFGSKFNGTPIGNHNNICTFSFQAIKHLTCIDGGALVLPHSDLYNRAKLLRWYGIDRNNNKKDFRCEADVSEWGFKFHMNDVNATVGIANLSEVHENVIDKHKANAKFYDNNLKDVKGLELLERDKRMESSFWIYSMKVERRNDFMKYMKECRIMVSQVHERNDIHSCVSEYKSILPNLDRTIKSIISIPVGWWVKKEHREHIIDCIKKGW